MPNVVDDPDRYFAGLVPGREDGLLLSLERQAREEHIPIVGPVVGRLLEILASASGARRVLELGCAIGYSAIFLGRAVRTTKGRVSTVERDARMAERAAGNIASAGLSGEVEVLRGDAASVLDGLQGPFDLIFLDIEKEAYLEMLPRCHRLLRPRGLLVADNTSFVGASAFVEELAGSPLWLAAHLFSYLPGHSPERDALSFALRV